MTSPSTEPTRFAFFDVDETVVRFKSMFSFNEVWCHTMGPFAWLLGRWRHRRFLRRFAGHLTAGRSREFINGDYYRDFAGRRRDQVLTCVDRWFRQVKRMPGGIYVPATLAIIREHQRTGTRIVLVSGSFHELLRPIAEEIGADCVLATRLEVVDGTYTGQILPPQMIGAGKAVAVRTLLDARGGKRHAAWGYGDHVSDVAMLEEVDHPHIVSNDPVMVDLARERGWAIVDPLAEPIGE